MASFRYIEFVETIYRKLTDGNRRVSLTSEQTVLPAICSRLPELQHGFPVIALTRPGASFRACIQRKARCGAVPTCPSRHRLPVASCLADTGFWTAIRIRSQLGKGPGALHFAAQNNEQARAFAQ
jgi:hypothetical protein